MSTDATTSTLPQKTDERPLSERIRENPRPALLWLGGLVGLLLLEVGRLLQAINEIGSAVGFVLDGLRAIPAGIGDNVGSSLSLALPDGVALLFGSFVGDLFALLILFVFAVAVAAVLPVRLIELAEIESTRRREWYIERGLLTAVLAIIAAVLALTPIGSQLQAQLSGVAGLLDSVSTSIPSLTSRELLPNQGHQTPDGGWSGTFLGLSPAQAWGLRVVVTFVYAAVLAYWFWRGYETFREHYRAADWTPRDDTIRRFRSNYWGLFGLLIVFMFLVLALWAPAISPVPIEHNVNQPWSESAEFEYLDDDGQVTTITHGLANQNTESDGQNVVSPFSYDQYDRFAPLGTTPRGTDLMTNLAYGARTSLVISLTAIFLATLIAITLSLVTAYYKGVADLLTVITSDSIQAIPVFLLVMMLSVIFQEGDHPIAEPLDGGVLLALILAFGFWPGIWRAIRGPSLQVAEEEWVDAAKSYGQSPSKIMRKHMAPYIAGYVTIYSSLLIGTMILVTAALSFLGLGIEHPTPEWGRIIDDGQPYVATRSWHVATISGFMIVLVVMAFNALGDALRDAIDPEADIDEGGAAGGGGG